MSKITGILLSLLILITGELCAQSKKELKAQKFMTKYDLPKAIDMYERLAEKGNQAAMEELGTLHYKLRNYKTAANWFHEAGRDRSLNKDALLNYGSLLLTLGYADSALTYFLEHSQSPGTTQDLRGENFALFILKMDNMPVDTQTYSIVRMPFNSKYSDFGPAFYGNGLVFCSERPKTVLAVTNFSSTSETPLLNLFYTEPKDTGFIRFKEPRMLDWGISTRFHEGPVATSSDSSVMYFTRSRPSAKGGANLVQIYKSLRKGKDWTNGAALNFPGFENAAYGYPALSKDGAWLYFAANAEGGMGGWDLYRVRISDENWGTPENLGPSINTPGNETMPFVHTDGTLYFSSDGQPGFGGMDLFYSVFREEAWQLPVNLGRPINSPYDDFSCLLDDNKKAGYFASNRLAKNRDDDIYRFSMKRPQFENCEDQVVNNYCYTLTEDETMDELPYMIYYQWDFGDGAQSQEIRPRHCYAGPGTYVVSLNMMDSLTGEPVYNQTTFDLIIENKVQPYISSPDTLVKGISSELHAKECNLPEVNIREYYWDFGDGYLGRGLEVSHTYMEEGVYSVSLGVTGDHKITGEPIKACVKKVLVVGKKMQVKPIGKVPKEAADSFPAVFDTVKAKDPSYGVQVGTALTSIPIDSSNFRGLQGISEVKDLESFRYIYGKGVTIDTAFVKLREAQDVGYDKASVLVFEKDSIAKRQPFQENWLPAEDFTFTTVKGNVKVPAKMELPEGGKIIWEEINTGQKILESSIDNETGDFLQNLPKGTFYGYFSDINGYYPISKQIDLMEAPDELVIKDTMELVSLKEMLEDNKPVRLNNLFFDYNKHDLKPASHQELYRVFRFLMENPSIKIEIGGHTDDRGPEAYNEELSKRRASSVAQFLLLAGSGSFNIKVVGYGEKKPLVSNATLLGRKFNRRVEFRILPNQ